MADNFGKFSSRRSTVYSTRGIVASTQPLATSAGLRILYKGGNCVDASIAVSAALVVTEPASTGIGGDCFALYYKKNEVLGLNATGRCARELTIQDIWDRYNDGKPLKRIPEDSIYSVTVPGAIAGWVDAHEKWGSGKVSLEEILEPAIELCEHGFPVSEISANIWKKNEKKLRERNPDLENNPFFINGHSPSEGDIMYNKNLAKALRLIAKNGKKAFYDGPIAEAIKEVTDSRGHKLSLEDLKTHTSTFQAPISLNLQGYNIWEISPNGQGLVALLALNIIQELHNSGKIDLYKLEHNSAEYLHLLIEVCKVAFYDSDEYVTDPDFSDIPLDDLLHHSYAKQRAKFYNPDSIIDPLTMKHGVPNERYKSDTVYLTVSDSNGEACSFINSVYEGFGSGIIVEPYGFALHNRGHNFNLVPGNKNCLEGGKRPYHTIIPGMITNADDNSLYASFGNMGGFMQPVGHVQHVLNLILFKFSPQESIDSPRFCLSPDKNTETDRGKGSLGPVSTHRTIVSLESGIKESVAEELRKKGHFVELVSGYDRSLFGRAQIIKKETRGDHIVYSGGSDLRGDGAAAPLI